jgi:hypothetical protein
VRNVRNVRKLTDYPLLTGVRNVRRFYRNLPLLTLGVPQAKGRRLESWPHRIPSSLPGSHAAGDCETEPLRQRRIGYVKPTKSGAIAAQIGSKRIGLFTTESLAVIEDGGDPITARHMRQDEFTFIPQYKIFIIGNHMPRLTSVGDAMKRRLKLIPFLNKPAKPDTDLPRKLEAEYPAILRWMIEGCLDWQKNGFVKCPAVEAERQSAKV